MNQIYNFVDMNIVFFNIINFLSGLFIITYNIKGLEDCSNIILLSVLSSLNSLITISWCINMCNNRLCNFIISLVLLIYNVNNYNNLGDNCINYFRDRAEIIWYYYIVNIFLQMYNVVSYTFLFCYAVVLLNRNPKNKTNKKIYLYENDENDDNLSILNRDLENTI